MKMLSKRTLLIVAVIIAILSTSYYAFFRGALGRQEGRAHYRTPDEQWMLNLERMQNSGRQPSPDEEEVIKMGHWMSYLTDKIVTVWLEQLDNRWCYSLNLEPTWPRCTGGVSRFLELNPPARREDIDEHLRPYIFVDGKKAELVDYPTPIPWSGAWSLGWRNNVARKELNIRVNWFRYPDAVGKVQGLGKGAYEWPVGDEASYGQIHGSAVAAIIRYAIKHGSFSGPIIGDDSFYIIGSWFGARKERYFEVKEPWLLFKKYNFRVEVNIVPIAKESESITNEEWAIVERIARLVEAEIIAYSLFGLEKFTILQARLGGEEFYLPAGRIGAGSYLVPIGYVIERVTGKRPIYDANLRQMKVVVKGQEEIVKGELIEAANRYFPIPEDERLVADWEAIQKLLGLRKVKDIRFEQ